MTAVAEALHTNNVLLSLDLHANGLHYRGHAADALATAIKMNHTLIRLDHETKDILADKDAVIHLAHNRNHADPHEVQRMERLVTTHDGMSAKKVKKKVKVEERKNHNHPLHRPDGKHERRAQRPGAVYSW